MRLLYERGPQDDGVLRLSTGGVSLTRTGQIHLSSNTEIHL